jgi:DNA-binding MarR family transcriptional regulator
LDITKEEYVALAAFRFALREFQKFSEKAAHSVGLTPQQHQALLTVKGFAGRDFVTIGELAERLQIRPHSAVGLVDRLVGQDLARRRHGEEDHRQVFIELTPHGLETLGALSAVHRQELSQVGPHLMALLTEMLHPATTKEGAASDAPTSTEL